MAIPQFRTVVIAALLLLLHAQQCSAEKFLSAPLNSYQLFRALVSEEEYYASVLRRIEVPSADAEVLVVPDDWRFLSEEPDVPRSKRDSFDRSYHFVADENTEMLHTDFPSEIQNYVDSLTQTTTASWGLDRIDQRTKPLNNQYTGYQDGLSDLRGVHIYIVDTGVDHHSSIPCTVTRDFDTYPSSPGNDCNGHGTHVAGIIASETYGVSPNPNHHIHAIRILDCAGSGTSADVLAGLLYIKANLQQPAVLNMSIGMRGTTSTLTNALTDIMNLGGVVVGAAGNQADNACNYFPPTVAGVVGVGALASTSDNLDISASYSNTGACVDIYSPGSGIISTLPGNLAGFKSGTSMACPFVVGAIAAALSSNLDLTGPDARTLVVSTRPTKDIVTGTGVPDPGDNVLFVIPATEVDTLPPPSPSTTPPPIASTTASTSTARATTAATTSVRASTTAGTTMAHLTTSLTSTAHAATTRAASTASTSTHSASTSTAHASTSTVHASTRVTTSISSTTRSASTRATTTAHSSTTNAAHATTSFARTTTRSTTSLASTTRSTSTRATTTAHTTSTASVRASTTGLASTSRVATTTIAAASTGS